MRPDYSVILPAHDEEEAIEPALLRLVHGLDGRYELLVVENGSRDRTFEVAMSVARTSGRVRVSRLARASYGQALRRGIEEATAPRLVLMDVDLSGLDFVHRSLPLLDHFDAVVGSKRMPGARDLRPLQRRVTTYLFNAAVRGITGYRGSDTHGVKALRREPALAALRACRARDEVFDTELMVRLARTGHAIAEIPVEVREIRPARRALHLRLPSVARGLAGLARLGRSAMPEPARPETPSLESRKTQDAPSVRVEAFPSRGRPRHEPA